VQAILDNLAGEPVLLRRQSLTALFLFVDLRITAATRGPQAVLAAAARLAAHPEPEPGRPSAIERRLANAYVAEAEGRPAAALAEWREGVANEGLLRTFGLDLEVRVRAADALVRAGGALDEAADLLRPVIVRARQGQEHLPVLLTGEALLGRLAAAPWEGRLAADELRQLADWRRTAPGLRASASGAETGGTVAVPAATTGANVVAANAAAADSVAAHAVAAHANLGVGSVGRATGVAGLGGAAHVVPAVASPVAPMRAAATATTRPAPAGIVLSEREREVLGRLAAGDSNKLIARAFDLSPHTVKRHVANILDKLDLTSRGQAAAWFREHAERR
jgi:LuxR family maltose regulon positive regulatory protein